MPSSFPFLCSPPTLAPTKAGGTFLRLLIRTSSPAITQSDNRLKYYPLQDICILIKNTYIASSMTEALTEFQVMGLRTCYPQIEHLGLLNILNHRNLRNDMYRKDCLIFPWIRSESLQRRSALPIPEDRNILSTKIGGSWKNLNAQALQVSSSLTTCSSYHFCPITFSQDHPLFIKPA